MSLTVTTASSTRLVTSVSTASGLAPGYTVFTTTMGKSSAGSRSTPSLVQETRPTTSSAPITISMNSGRRMAILVSCIPFFAPAARLARRQRGPRVDLRGDDVAVVQITQTAGCHELSVVDATQDFDESIVLEPE